MTKSKPTLGFKLPPAKPTAVTDEAKAKAFETAGDAPGQSSSPAPPAAAASKPAKQEKARLTVYIPPDVDKRLRHAVVDDGADLSEAVTKALEAWLASRK